MSREKLPSTALFCGWETHQDFSCPQKKPSQLKYFVFDISRYAFIESPTSRFFLLPFIDLMLDL